MKFVIPIAVEVIADKASHIDDDAIVDAIMALDVTSAFHDGHETVRIAAAESFGPVRRDESSELWDNVAFELHHK